MSAVPSRPRNSVRSAVGFTTAPDSRCEPGCLPFSSTATGTSPRRSATSGAPSSSWPSLIAQARPAGPAPTIRTPTSMRSSAGSLGSATNSLASNGGGKSAGRTLMRPCARGRARSSFGTTSLTSPTTARSANSKMGAFGSLLIATITFDDCIPTLCWMAPEMPQPM